MLVRTELFNIAVNDIDAKKSHYIQVFVVTEFVVGETQCTSCTKHAMQRAR